MPLPAVLAAGGALAPLTAVLFSAGFASFISFVILPVSWIVVRALGIGTITYIGLDIVETQVVNYIIKSFDDVKSSTFSALYHFAVLLNIDFLINSIISAYATRLTIFFLCGGAKFRKLTWFQDPC